MYIKIGYYDDKEIDDDKAGPIETLIECNKYHLSRDESSRLWLITKGEEESTYVVDSCTVWVMNDMGQTIDKLR